MARDFAPGSVCHIYLQPGQSQASVEDRPELWNCKDTGWRVESDEALIRFDLRGAQAGSQSRYFVARAAPFDRLTLTAIAPGGETRSEHWTNATMRVADGVTMMAAPVPETAGPPVAVIARIVRPGYASTITSAQLSTREPSGWVEPLDIFLILVCGLLIAPILFDLAYFRALRERFLLWHAAMGTMMLAYAATSGGLLNRLIPLTVAQFQPIMAMTFSLAIASAAMFYRCFVEPDILDVRDRRLLTVSALFCVFLGAFLVVRPLPEPLMQTVYFAGWVPMVGVVVWLLFLPLWRGSRAARFQVVAWSPLVITGFYRVGGNLGFTDKAVDAFPLFYVSIAFEVIVTALGVADRFMTLKREHDRARVEVRLLGEMAERDPLTGLLNRRAVETRFQSFIASGYTTVGLVDLDHF